MDVVARPEGSAFIRSDVYGVDLRRYSSFYMYGRALNQASLAVRVKGQLRRLLAPVRLKRDLLRTISGTNPLGLDGDASTLVAPPLGARTFLRSCKAPRTTRSKSHSNACRTMVATRGRHLSRSSHRSRLLSFDALPERTLYRDERHAEFWLPQEYYRYLSSSHARRTCDVHHL